MPTPIKHAADPQTAHTDATPPHPVHERSCAVCGSARKRVLYEQRFSGLSAQSILKGYAVSVCEACGFAFADRLPDQQAFDRYYRDMSKYEQQHNLGGGDADRVRCRNIADMLESFLPDRAARILDIGCATGRTLGLLKENGYANVLGIDPSQACARHARELYDVEVLPYTISTMPEWVGRFDAVMLIAVIEHVQTLQALVQRLTGLLSEGGLLLLEHPDATRFTPAAGGPFQEFSTEHVNFFSRTSLQNLMRPHRLAEIHSYQEDRLAAEGVAVPSSSSLFRKERSAMGPLVRDDQTAVCLSRYIRESQRIEDTIREKIVRLVESRTRLVIWGVGTHTQHLMETTPLKEANIVAFVDSNVRYKGKRLNGVPILLPGALKAMSEAVLVSSMISQREIVRQMRDELRVENPAILLY
jgi:SAM-dependent methyltransferase